MSVAESGDTLQVHFISKRPDGEIFEDTHTREPVTLTLGKKQINPAFEEALLGKSEGDTVTVVLPPEKAYGKYLKRLVIPIKRKKLRLDSEPSPGDIITVEVFDRLCKVTVAEVTDTKIIVDANHPLAGETMTYEITIVTIIKHD
ncbi:FKBP-type 16 kDa peptidyl-prolyl cis-trans isomerase [bioreactor metagenome]|uniref:peptidylprolyl isomerase n=1 Tax=bioreactor metagenome TaxID=1076179 RepID=A0A644UKR2_9ZZZZ|nr:FKBP-type peptidyl-prolyl cis-trans isomerase [Methanocorpusculum sp.]